MKFILQAPIRCRLQSYADLIRLDKPVGTALLLWPTLGGLWIASGGVPKWQLLMIFSVGTFLMRCAGCAINDYADRDFDRHVERTAHRPVTSGRIESREALLIAALLTACSLLLIQPLNTLAKQLSLPAVLLAGTYPYFKRFFALPQAYLGVAFGFGIPMAFAAVLDQVPVQAWILLIANVFWTVAYDTEYAMIDREDDLKIGIKTSAITFGRFDVAIIMLCYATHLALLLLVGIYAALGAWLKLGIASAAGCAAYHYLLIRQRDRSRCFAAFRHNNYLGAIVIAGIVADYAIR